MLKRYRKVVNNHHAVVLPANVALNATRRQLTKLMGHTVKGIILLSKPYYSVEEAQHDNTGN